MTIFGLIVWTIVYLFVTTINVWLQLTTYISKLYYPYIYMYSIHYTVTSN